MAALGDLSFNLLGYIVIFFNDLFTALNGVILKRTSEGKLSGYCDGARVDLMLLYTPHLLPHTSHFKPLPFIKQHAYYQNIKGAK